MDFQGFQNSIPDFLVLICAVLLIGIAILSYRKIKSIPILPRVGFIVLRSASFILILLLFLLNPYFFSSEIIDQKPRIMVFLDNSESVSIKKGIYNGIDSFQEVIKNLNIGSNSEIELDFFSIGSSSRKINNPDSLTFLESETNFASVISQAQELEDDFDAGIIVSDGIITYGKNPIIQASNLTIPLYTLSLGDTSKVKDVVLKNLVYSPNGFTDTKHLVEVQVLQNGFSGNETEIILLNSDKEEIDSRIIRFNESDQIISENFEIELKETGLQQFTIKVKELLNEWSVENNVSTLSIDVSDSKTRVLHASFEVHPDVKMIRSILSSDENIELKTLTWLGGNSFVEDETIDIGKIDLIIFHGLPTNNQSLRYLSDYQSKPTLYLQLPKSRKNQVSVFNEVDLINNSGNQLYEVNMEPFLDNIDHPIMELPEIGYQNISPVIGSLRSISNTPDALTLFKSAFQNIQTPNDLVTVLERGNIRRATVSSWGWYKMYQSPNVTERDFVSQLFLNLSTWTSNNPDERKLKITPSRSVFNNNEEVIINANLNNESGEPESGATIEITITSDENIDRTFNMSNDRDGNYNLSLKSLSAGLYSFSATARKGDREIDSQKGEFLIQKSNSELINTVRNDNFMRNIAKETNAEFFTYDNISNFWETLNNDGVLNLKKVEVESYTFPVRSMFWFILVLVLLSAEWIGRKFYSLP